MLGVPSIGEANWGAQVRDEDQNWVSCSNGRNGSERDFNESAEKVKRRGEEVETS